MNKREFKDRLHDRFAAVGKALSSPKRVELLDLLTQTERSVEWLAEATGMSIANTSQHLQVLRGARLVESRKEGLRVFYRLASPAVWELYRSLRAVAEERDAEVERLERDWFAASDPRDPIGVDELAASVRRGEVLAIDVRPPEEFQAGHIDGALSVPLDDLDALAPTLPRDRRIVAYCRGRYCVFAGEAARRLRELGFDAARLEVGFPEWRAAGLPVAEIRS